jgi:hypothetical protein
MGMGGLEKMRKDMCFLLVIPAKAGIHFDFRDAVAKSKARWIPAFAGMTVIPYFGDISSISTIIVHVNWAADFELLKNQSPICDVQLAHRLLNGNRPHSPRLPNVHRKSPKAHQGQPGSIR